MDHISLTALDVGFDIREHGMAARIPSTGILSVRCHPRGTTLRVTTVEGPAAEVWEALRARGYEVVAPIDMRYVAEESGGCWVVCDCQAATLNAEPYPHIGLSEHEARRLADSLNDHWMRGSAIQAGD